MNRGRPRKNPEPEPGVVERIRNTLDKWNQDPDAGVESSTTTTVDGEPSSANPIFGENKPLHAQLGQRELARALCWLYKGISRLPNIKSTAEFRESDFEEEAKQIIDLLNRYPMLRFVTRLLGPLSSISGFADKWERMMQARTVTPVKQPGTGKTVKWGFRRKQAESEQPVGMFDATESVS